MIATSIASAALAPFTPLIKSLRASSYQHIHIADGLIESAQAARSEFDKHFSEPRKAHASRFVWDFWHVTSRQEDNPTLPTAGSGYGAAADGSIPNHGQQYTFLRVPAAEYFETEVFESLCAEITEYAPPCHHCRVALSNSHAPLVPIDEPHFAMAGTANDSWDAVPSLLRGCRSILMEARKTSTPTLATALLHLCCLSRLVKRTLPWTAPIRDGLRVVRQPCSSRRFVTTGTISMERVVSFTLSLTRLARAESQLNDVNPDPRQPC